jgi:tight adherence protein B
VLTYLLYFSTFVTGVLLFELVSSFYLARRARVHAVNRRMMLLEDNAALGEVSEALRLERGIGGAGPIGFHLDSIKQLYTQSGLTMRLANLMAVCLAVSFALGLVAWFWDAPFIAALGLFALFAVTLPLLVMRLSRRRRIEQFTRQLPDALDVVVRSLQAGHPFTAAVALVAREMPDPLGSEFGLLSDELGFGSDIEVAMVNLAERVGAPDLQFVTIALSIHKSSGGNLAEILANLSSVIRQRYIFRAKVRALSAEGRFSAKLMSVFPIILYFIITFLAPNYYDSIWEAGIEVPFFTFCAVSTVIGNIILRKMVNFDF